MSDIDLQIELIKARARAAAQAEVSAALATEQRRAAEASEHERRQVDAQLAATRRAGNPLAWMTYRPEVRASREPAQPARPATSRPASMQLGAEALDDLRWRAQTIIAERRSSRGLSAGVIDLSDADVPTIRRELILHGCTL